VSFVAGHASRQELEAVLSGLPTDVVETVLDYTPVSVSEEEWASIRPFLVSALPPLEPQTVDAVKKHLYPLLAFASWGLAEGIPLTIGSLFVAENVETWREVAHRRAKSGGGRSGRMSTGTVSDYVSRLRWMGPILNPVGHWPPTPGAIPGGVKRHLRGQYTDDEVRTLDRLVGTLRPGRQRDLAESVLVCGLGFGPQPGELLRLEAGCLVERADGLSVAVYGDRPREVPVGEAWADRLRRIAAQSGGNRLVPVAASKNALTHALKSLQLGPDAPLLSPARLRTTWMVDRLRAGADPRVLLLDWAGLTSLSNLPDLVSHLPGPDRDASLAVARLDPRRAG
jgi:hypothetical protein